MVCLCQGDIDGCAAVDLPTLKRPSSTVCHMKRLRQNFVDMGDVALQTTLSDEFKDPLFQRALMDVHMMVCLNGHERTVPEW